MLSPDPMRNLPGAYALPARRLHGAGGAATVVLVTALPRSTCRPADSGFAAHRAY